MKRHWKLKTILLASLSVLLFATYHAPTASASNPTTINFQGKVVNANGTNVTNGTYSFLFKMYTASSGGIAVWTETDSLTVTNGVFQVNLGNSCLFFTANACNNSTPINFSTNPNIYLGITFNSDPAGEMTPRVQLQSVPYAYNADNLGGLGSSQYAQLSPGSAQTGFISINGALTLGGSQTFSGTTAQTISGPTTGGLTVTVSGGPLSLSTTTSGILSLQSAGALNLNGAADSTWDLGITHTLSLQTTNNGPITTGSGLVTVGGNISVAGTYNGNTLNSAALTFSAASANTISGSSGQNLTIQSQGTGQLILNSANATLGISSTVTSLQRTATGQLNFDLNDVATTTLQIENSGAGIANLNLFGGSLETGSSPVIRLTNAGALTNITTIGTSGSVTVGGGITGGAVEDNRTNESVATTYTESNPGVEYYLAANSTTTNTSFTTTFNITGIATTNGTFAAITGSAQKGITSAARIHTVIVQINGATISTLATTSVTTAQTVTRSFMIMRQNGAWAVVGEGPTAIPASTTSTFNTADFAEWVEYSGNNRPQPGDVLTVGSVNQSVQASQSAYDPTTLGVVSTSPYQVASADDGHSVIIALTGRVPVNVNLQNGAIKPGDPLTASSTPGQAMKAVAPGRIIGIALDAYDGSQTSNQAYVQLGVGYDDPSAAGVINSSLTSSGGLVINSGTSSTTQVYPNTYGGGSITTIPTNGSGLTPLTGLLNISDPTFNKISDRNGSFNSVVSPSLVSSGALAISSGSDSTVSIDNSGGNVSIGNQTSNVVINGTLQTNGTTNNYGNLNLNFKNANNSLNIDNSTADSAIGSAIDITDSSRNGYIRLISSPNFKVSGNGDIDTNGSIVARGGGFELFSNDGSRIISFDQSGNASFAGSLDLSNAYLNGALNVGGDIKVSGLSTFQKLATFIAKTIFKSDVEFQGHITVNSDSAGYASLRTGESLVHVIFQSPYTRPPVVTATNVNGQYGLISVNNVTDQGFDLSLSNPVNSLTIMSWNAVDVNNPQTATNPLPITNPQSNNSPNTSVNGQ
jgi:fibronectin-binding autotransporter adhesin